MLAKKSHGNLSKLFVKGIKIEIFVKSKILFHKTRRIVLLCSHHDNSLVQVHRGLTFPGICSKSRAAPPGEFGV